MFVILILIKPHKFKNMVYLVIKSVKSWLILMYKNKFTKLYKNGIISI